MIRWATCVDGSIAPATRTCKSKFELPVIFYGAKPKIVSSVEANPG